MDQAIKDTRFAVTSLPKRYDAVAWILRLTTMTLRCKLMFLVAAFMMTMTEGVTGSTRSSIQIAQREEIQEDVTTNGKQNYSILHRWRLLED